MATAKNLHPKFVTDREGRKTEVILPIDEYNELLEDLHDLAVIAERKDEPTISFDKVKEELKGDGYLSD